MYKSVFMESGIEVRCRPAPPFIMTDVRMALPPPPKYPEVEVRSGDGKNVEVHPALRGTPEYEEWNKARREHEHLVERTNVNFTLDYGVVDWRFPGEDEYEDMPPDAWVRPDVMDRWNIPLGTEAAARRLEFIKHLIVMTDVDANQVNSITLSTTPLTWEEIMVAVDPTRYAEAVDQ